MLNFLCDLELFAEIQSHNYDNQNTNSQYDNQVTNGQYDSQNQYDD